MSRSSVALSASAILVLLLCSTSVRSDGMAFLEPIGVEQRKPDLAEDLQLVYIEANQTHQHTELFVAVKPWATFSYNITLAVPMVSPPTGVEGARTPTERFREETGLSRAEQRLTRTNLTLGVANTASYFNFFRKRTALHLLIPFSSLSTIGQAIRGYTYPSHWGRSMGMEEGTILGVEHVASYVFQGISMDVYRFDDYSSLGQLLQTLGLEASESAKEEVQKYNAHYISALTVQLLPPVDPETLESLQKNCPKTLEEFFDWLPTKKLDLEGLRQVFGKAYQPNLLRLASQMFASDARQEFRATADSDATQGSTERQAALLADSMAELVEAYLSFPEEGYKISFWNEHDGALWYPLGTSSSWSHPIGLIEVLITLPKGLWLEGMKPTPSAKYSTASSRAFFWRMTDANPRVDLSAKLSKGSVGPLLLAIRNGLAEALASAYKPVAASANMLFHLAAWIISMLLAGTLVTRGWSERRSSHFLGMAAFLCVVTFFTSILFVLPLLFARRKRSAVETRGNEAQNRADRKMDLLIPLIVSWIVFGIGVVFISSASDVPAVAIYFLVASGIWFLLAALAFGTPGFEWTPRASARYWSASIACAFASLTIYSLSLVLALMYFAGLLLVVAIRSSKKHTPRGL